LSLLSASYCCRRTFSGALFFSVPFFFDCFCHGFDAGSLAFLVDLALLCDAMPPKKVGKQFLKNNVASTATEFAVIDTPTWVR
jgi:hypothetical protein